jgi:hypothetical protein
MKKIIAVGLVLIIFTAACSAATGENGNVTVYAAPT